jgi:N-acyl homoserine lactone hydrolase
LTNCIIHPIPLAEAQFEKSLMTYGFNFGQLFHFVIYVWYIEGPKQRILVDAGGNMEYMTKLSASPAKGIREIQTLGFGLSKLGIDFGDIDLVIFTHLHHDHVAEASKFPKARFLVQIDELECAQNPHPALASRYHFYKEYLSSLKFEVVNGDTMICDEISVLKTPGHTPGGQSVSVKTAQGTAVIAGLCTIRENFEPSSPVTLPVITPGIHVNVLDAYDSLLRIKETADIVVPLHDSEFLRKNTIP